MKKCIWMLLIAALLMSGCSGTEPLPSTESTALKEPVAEITGVPETEPVVYFALQDEVFVAVKDYIPDIQIDLKYSGTDNFTGQAIYEFSNAYLRYGTVKKLTAVQQDLKELGYGLKIWDGFRPVSAQHKLWEAYPDSRYVANPKTGFSSHSRGNTVDVTLVDHEGKEVPMPTGFDDFSALADRNYSDCTQDAADNALILEILMEKHGFTGYNAEWWHFSDTMTYPVEEQFKPID